MIALRWRWRWGEAQLFLQRATGIRVWRVEAEMIGPAWRGLSYLGALIAASQRMGRWVMLLLPLRTISQHGDVVYKTRRGVGGEHVSGGLVVDPLGEACVAGGVRRRRG